MQTTTIVGGTVPPSRRWRTAMFDCCSSPGGCDRCCYVSFCLPCAAGEVAGRIGRDYSVDCCLPSLTYAIGAAFGPFGSYAASLVGSCLWAQTRTVIRREDAIPGDEVEDCLTMLLCAPCAVCQELNHLDMRDFERSGAKTTITVVQQPQQQMVMAAAPVMAAPMMAPMAPVMPMAPVSMPFAPSYPGPPQMPYGGPPGYQQQQQPYPQQQYPQQQYPPQQPYGAPSAPAYGQHY